MNERDTVMKLTTADNIVATNDQEVSSKRKPPKRIR
jgi:hypothetical protein